jgi:hypothetical protein
MSFLTFFLQHSLLSVLYTQTFKRWWLNLVMDIGVPPIKDHLIIQHNNWVAV